MKKTMRDVMVLSHLRRDARTTLTEMSKRTKVPISTLHELLEAKQWRSTLLPDFSDIGYTTKAHLIMKVRPSEKDLLKEYLRTHVFVNSLYKINNGWDFMCEVICRNLNEFESFIEKLEARFTVKVETHHIIQDIAREQFLADPAYLPAIVHH